ncbi:CPBP family intramembrane glutamic endopeptidase [Ureibacillus xyleni]|uniref:CPBP family intramembrane glutamic endopeptidase n=1 Tax=Ureibacillus xyleni TaxID=614648 RepID=UPI0011421DA7|nr:CPBP family intramembrane glutamic endopeptidase [Ureibacillus xyleni]
MFGLESKRNRLIVYLSPLFIIAVVHMVATISYKTIPSFSWIITAISYWGLTGLMKYLFVPSNTLRDWLKKPVFIKKWLIIGLVVGIFPAVGILAFNVNLLVEYPMLTLFLFLFALINPWFEEGYWRGMILDAGDGMSIPRWLNIGYSTFFFVLSHPLMWGVFSIANRSIQMYISLLVMGIVWSMIRYKTGSLRWSVYSHMLVDVGNLSVFVFLNLYVPPHMK